ncbi:redoxin domain-containing protein [Sulfurimonas sp.]
MKSKIKQYIKEIIYFIIITTLFANAMSLYRSQDLTKEPLNIKNLQLINNTKYKIPNKKPILIHFWATWCPTCKLEAANINFLAKHFEVLTIAVKSGNNSEIKQYLKEHHYTFKVVNDKNGILSHKFKITAFPTTFIYDKNHHLALNEVGYTSTFGLFLRMWWVNL